MNTSHITLMSLKQILHDINFKVSEGHEKYGTEQSTGVLESVYSIFPRFRNLRLQQYSVRQLYQELWMPDCVDIDYLIWFT